MHTAGGLGGITALTPWHEGAANIDLNFIGSGLGRPDGSNIVPTVVDERREIVLHKARLKIDGG